ncbi:MAG: AbiEi antitoxin N-terminal domain-containing protein [Flavobacteriaceae bacterium]|nr:AbiEi antitoxin N-terminal domain-containing protein [Flavobacteriaceae bacterium]
MSGIEHIFSESREHLIYLRSWLKELGLSHSDQNGLIEEGVLQPIGRGILTKSGEYPGILSSISALQKQENRPIHVGELSALIMLR